MDLTEETPKITNPAESSLPKSGNRNKDFLRMTTMQRRAKIYLRGGSKELKRQIRHAANWMLFDQLGKRLAPKIEVMIYLASGLEEREGIVGDCGIGGCETVRPKEYEIRLELNQDTPDFYRTLAHEIVHLRQWAKDQMYEYENERHAVRFKGKKYNMEDMDDDDYPWEVEAYSIQEDIYSRYISSHKLSEIESAI